MAAFQRILVPVDGSEGSDRACAFAARLASATGAAVTLLHVVELTSAEVMGMRSLSEEEVQRRMKEMATPTLARAGQAMGAPERPLKLEEVIALGHAADEVIGWAAQHGPDMIVMGNRGLGPLQELLLGSVSEKVVRRAPCPVTIAR